MGKSLGANLKAPTLYREIEGIWTPEIPPWKRPMDIILASVGLILSFPLMIVIYLFVKLSSKGCAIYKQQRPGLCGRDFFMLKFRTMYQNSDEILEKYLKKHPEAKREWEQYKKLKSYDPRLTPIGRFLRKYSLDELPQFINVLKGDMSIVGPRPYLYREFVENDIPSETIKEILSVKPGLTGLWQVSGRNDLPFDKRIELDVKYVRNQSFLLDLKIILKTIYVVITGKGAY